LIGLGAGEDECEGMDYQLFVDATVLDSWTARVVLAGRPENGEPGFVDRVGRSANVDGYRVTLSEWSLRLANSLVWAGASPQGTVAVEDQEVHIPDVADRDLLSPQEMAALVEDLVAEERGARQAAADAAAAATPPPAAVERPEPAPDPAARAAVVAPAQAGPPPGGNGVTEEKEEKEEAWQLVGSARGGLSARTVPAAAGTAPLHNPFASLLEQEKSSAGPLLEAAMVNEAEAPQAVTDSQPALEEEERLRLAEAEEVAAKKEVQRLISQAGVSRTALMKGITAHLKGDRSGQIKVLAGILEEKWAFFFGGGAAIMDRLSAAKSASSDIQSLVEAVSSDPARGVSMLYEWGGKQDEDNSQELPRQQRKQKSAKAATRAATVTEKKDSQRTLGQMGLVRAHATTATPGQQEGGAAASAVSTSPPPSPPPAQPPDSTATDAMHAVATAPNKFVTETGGEGGATPSS
jgi:hypothetical protein